MDINFVKELMKEFKACELTKFELKYDDVQIKLEKKKETVVTQAPMPVMSVSSREEVASCSPAPAVFGNTEQKPSKVDGHEVKAPMVGTVYIAPSPDAPPFVKIGQKVKKGDVICIIEAMKLMNEVEAEVDGEVVDIVMQNESMVQFGQTLIVVAPNK